ncbi:MAG: hypothetical protein A3J07_00920 [Candidatus Doudnabacteria bacterium RIFCSPLOWO2_02_FULL_49_13]|uniref:Uncharacterized protein n=1 Tax=Candidatus Doudnabacteria bacterium RIFCSPHIGHO2_12_FULL_48_16 TaxID=1817838 RepID=A0A1F5PK48_9BACT|nr:MAG: hypothetical protein A3B77_04485 [Candidatus Doudnabacteria bacterium RIFCSPHIGHO2_02_FULL_49_24]OGE89912.1 MAG: hypothetical protein A2760_04380 [Candidatus Doudnabacteria bacterium RIFCSPHIGHO2_01_FULL_50_67]OGE90313.1 MAG: hypothetical protein A3E29_04430 [Candidatus Doudnabacteria bacterium RIFCSPHIGHO2_12_FULL_48_16]OGE96741.1 MAG: hypothetical protein A2990_00420 [Candidatus Doudnabacteria bacterium RIFCSPLOWO2_01_FULL_49_40]OGF02369.1 MAG: hypothetical protein A3J07_00920 [Candid
MRRLLERLQNQPYETRVKILWITTVVIAIGLLIIWTVNLKSTIKNSDGQSAPPQEPASSELTNQFLGVERVERIAGSLKIYFTLKNETNDILNVSKTDDISLTVDEGSLHPGSLLDRQGQPLAQKVLSHTQIFGIMNFKATNDKTGVLSFDNLFLEKNPDKIFRQELDLDFDKLNQSPNVRN